MKLHLILAILILGLASSSFAQNQKRKGNRPQSPTPTHADVAYDKHERTKLDFWQAKGAGTRPLLVYIHGGGWMKGDKRAMRNAGTYLKEGISVASINYRLTVTDPLPAPVHDAARAVQFLRSKAGEWNIDKNNVVLSGGSAGACSALWIACHDDLANPDSKDPVERESTRVQGAGVVSAQTSIDPKQIEPWIGPKVFLSMIYKAVGEDSLEEALKNYDKHEAVYKEFSPINHLSKDDPPLFLEYSPKLPMTVPATSFNHGIHHGLFGVKLKEKSAVVGHNKVQLFIKGHDESKAYANADDFLMKILLGSGMAPAAEIQADPGLQAAANKPVASVKKARKPIASPKKRRRVTPVASANDGPVIRLWPIERVGGEQNRLKEDVDTRRGKVRFRNIKDPNLTVYPVDSAAPTPAVIYCPGGAYKLLGKQPDVIQWLNDLGFTVFMLKYTVPDDREAAFRDVQRAVRLVRHQAEKWNIDPDAIGILGQSAGGHLSARLSQNYQQAAYEPIDAADKESCEPKFVIVVSGAYFLGAADGPALTKEFHMKNPVGPTFLVYAKDDKWCPGGVAYEKALREAGFSAHIELYEKGGHGLRNVNWYPECTKWLKAKKLIQ